MSNQLAEIMHKKRQQISSLLPKNYPLERLYRIALMEVNRNPKLALCDPSSIWSSILDAAQLNLEIGSLLGHCYLIPYKEKCQFQLGYKGMLSLLDRSERLLFTPMPEIIYKNDDYIIQYGDEPKIKHTPNYKVRRIAEDIVGVYCVLFYKNGARPFIYMPIEEVYKIRETAVSYRYDKNSSSIWYTNLEEMIKKTVLKRAFKYCPIDLTIQRAIENDNQADAGKQINYLEDPVEMLENDKEDKKMNKTKELLNDINKDIDINPSNSETTNAMATIANIVNELDEKLLNNTL